MTREDEGLERIINLSFAFLNAEKLGRSYLHADWVYHNVAGYKTNAQGETRSKNAASKLFERDRKLLHLAGMPIETVRLDDRVGYRLQAEHYGIAEVSFTPEEATVLALAGQMGQGSELSAFSRSGWTKLAALGFERDSQTTAEVNTSGDVTKVAVSDFDALLSAVNNKRTVVFEYRLHPQADPMQRMFDPWGIVTHLERFYAVGYDHQRQDVRVFRMSRIRHVRPADSTLVEQHQFVSANTDDLESLVVAVLNRNKVLVDAEVRLHGAVPDWMYPFIDGAASEQQHIQLKDVERDFFIRAAIAESDTFEVLRPTELRQQILDRVREYAAAQYATQCSAQPAKDAAKKTIGGRA